MRRTEVTLPAIGHSPGGRYRVAFQDDADRAMAVTRVRDGRQARAIAITSPEARAAIAAALAAMPRTKPSRKVA